MRRSGRRRPGPAARARGGTRRRASRGGRRRGRRPGERVRAPRRWVRDGAWRWGSDLRRGGRRTRWEGGRRPPWAPIAGGTETDPRRWYDQAPELTAGNGWRVGGGWCGGFPGMVWGKVRWGGSGVA